MNNTHPICKRCWNKRVSQIKTKSRRTLTEPKEEICCDCGDGIVSGLYIMEDPEKVNYCQQKLDLL